MSLRPPPMMRTQRWRVAGVLGLALLALIGLLLLVQGRGTRYIVEGLGQDGEAALLQRLDAMGASYRLTGRGEIAVAREDLALVAASGGVSVRSEELQPEYRLYIIVTVCLFGAAAMVLTVSGARRRIRPEHAENRFRTSAETVDASYLETEHPQAIAAYLLWIPPETAAGIVTALPPTLRRDVWARVNALPVGDPAALRTLAMLFQAKADRTRQQNAIRSRVEAILAQCDPATRDMLAGVVTPGSAAKKFVRNEEMQ